MRIPTAMPAATRPVGGAAAPGEAAGFARLIAPPAPGGAPAIAPPVLPAAGRIAGLLALHQAAPRPADRRAALRRAGSLLDRLGEIQLALVQGAEDTDSWRELGELLDQDRPTSGLAGLDALLEAIELRAAVELAKREMAEREMAGPEAGSAAKTDQPDTPSTARTSPSHSARALS